MSVRRRQRIQAAAQAKAIDAATVAITAALGAFGLLAGLASLLR